MMWLGLQQPTNLLHEKIVWEILLTWNLLNNEQKKCCKNEITCWNSFRNSLKKKIILTPSDFCILILHISDWILTFFCDFCMTSHIFHIYFIYKISQAIFLRSYFVGLCVPLNIWANNYVTYYLYNYIFEKLDFDCYSISLNYFFPFLADGFLSNQLKPTNFTAAAATVHYPVALNMRPLYDHSYYFIATFMRDHIDFHARALLCGPKHYWLKRIVRNSIDFYNA